jgi:hypothetical protein
MSIDARNLLRTSHVDDSFHQILTVIVIGLLFKRQPFGILNKMEEVLVQPFTEFLLTDTLLFSLNELRILVEQLPRQKTYRS